MLIVQTAAALLQVFVFSDGDFIPGEVKLSDIPGRGKKREDDEETLFRHRRQTVECIK